MTQLEYNQQQEERQTNKFTQIFFRLAGNGFFAASLVLNFFFWSAYGEKAEAFYLFVALGLMCDIIKVFSLKLVFLYYKVGERDISYFENTKYQRYILFSVIFVTVAVSLAAAYSYMHQKSVLVANKSLQESESYKRLVKDLNHAKSQERVLQKYEGVDISAVQAQEQAQSNALQQYWDSPLTMPNGTIVGQGMTNGNATNRCTQRIKKWRSYYDRVCNNRPALVEYGDKIEGYRNLLAVKERIVDIEKKMKEAVNSSDNGNNKYLLPGLPIGFISFFVIIFVELGPILFYFLDSFVSNGMKHPVLVKAKTSARRRMTLQELNDKVFNLKVKKIVEEIEEAGDENALMHKNKKRGEESEEDLDLNLLRDQVNELRIGQENEGKSTPFTISQNGKSSSSQLPTVDEEAEKTSTPFKVKGEQAIMGGMVTHESSPKGEQNLDASSSLNAPTGNQELFMLLGKFQ